MSKINLINGGVSRAIDTLVTANIRDSLDGELTLSFTLHNADVAYVNDTTTVQYNGQYYNIISYDKGVNGQCPECPVECEHVSYDLNNEEYSLDNFAVTGTPSQLLSVALAGTPFSVGTVEPATAKTVVINETTSRRAVVYAVAAAVGGEIEYNGYNINLRTHRGSESYIELLDTGNVTDVSVSRNKRDGTTSYNVTLGRKTTLTCGDNVHIVFTPLSINVNIRIFAVDYNPYNPYEISIEVGDYVPDIVDTYSSLTTEIKNVRHDFTVANGEFTSRIETDEGNISTLQQDYASIKLRVENTEGDITTLELNATSLTSRVTNAEGNISTIDQYAHSLTLTVTNGSTSSTIQLKAGSTVISSQNVSFSGIVTFSSLSTAGQSEINGDNITTGKISAGLIKANNGSNITFGAAILLDGAYPEIAGITTLRFGEYSYINKVATSNSPAYNYLEIYSYEGVHMSGAGGLITQKIRNEGNLSIDAFDNLSNNYTIFIGTAMVSAGGYGIVQNIQVGNSNNTSTINLNGTLRHNGNTVLDSANIGSYVVFQ